MLHGQCIMEHLLTMALNSSDSLAPLLKVSLNGVQRQQCCFPLLQRFAGSLHISIACLASVQLTGDCANQAVIAHSKQPISDILILQLQLLLARLMYHSIACLLVYKVHIGTNGLES